MTTPRQQNSHPTPLLAAKNIGISFGERQVLHNVALEVHPGRIVTLIGPNGAGKTTLVRIVLGLLQPDTGSISRADNLSIGYMPQKLQIGATMPITVRGFLKLAQGSKNRQQNEERINQVLDDLNIRPIERQQLSALSGGELQRVLLARALQRRPRLLVLDEPAQGVDIAGQAELYQLIGEISSRENCGVLMISHDLHLVMSATDEVICLNHHICCHGRPEQVSNDPAYLELFGKQAASNLAVYTHRHNHSHDIDGNVVEHRND